LEDDGGDDSRVARLRKGEVSPGNADANFRAKLLENHANLRFNPFE
jgi:hypothetical protein